jgi:MoaA/NifB/PqqE/SkfB family radical SAM enzyme
MIEYRDWLTRKFVNLDLSNKCTLECPRCSRRKFKNKKDIPGHYMTDEEWKMYLTYFDSFLFCGQFSDPMMHPKFPNMLKDIHSVQKRAEVYIAASHRNKDFFVKCFKALPASSWIFGIDGLPANSSKYRIRQDGEKLFDMMLLSKEYVENTIWQYIIFKYNEYEMDQARELAEKYNIQISFLKSNRFAISNDVYKPSEGLYIKKEDDRYVP